MTRLHFFFVICKVEAAAHYHFVSCFLLWEFLRKNLSLDEGKKSFNRQRLGGLFKGLIQWIRGVKLVFLIFPPLLCLDHE